MRTFPDPDPLYGARNIALLPSRGHMYPTPFFVEVGESGRKILHSVDGLLHGPLPCQLLGKKTPREVESFYEQY